MQRNSKLLIFAVLIIVAIIVWIPRRTKTAGASSTTSSVTFDQAIPVVREVTGKRTESVNWGRNPFTFPHRKEAGNVSHLKLFSIIWNDKESQAFINDSIVRVGDKITNKTIKQIEPNRVILTDGTKDYVLKLKE